MREISARLSIYVLTREKTKKANTSKGREKTFFFLVFLQQLNVFWNSGACKWLITQSGYIEQLLKCFACKRSDLLRSVTRPTLNRFRCSSLLLAHFVTQNLNRAYSEFIVQTETDTLFKCSPIFLVDQKTFIVEGSCFIER